MPSWIESPAKARGLVVRGTRSWRRGWSWLRTSLPRIVKQVAGFPDYAAYLDHCRRAGHPPGLTERQFLDEFFAAKGGRARCC